MMTAATVQIFGTDIITIPSTASERLFLAKQTHGHGGGRVDPQATALPFGTASSQIQHQAIIMEGSLKRMAQFDEMGSIGQASMKHLNTTSSCKGPTEL